VQTVLDLARLVCVALSVLVISLSLGTLRDVAVKHMPTWPWFTVSMIAFSIVVAGDTLANLGQGFTFLLPLRFVALASAIVALYRLNVFAESPPDWE
jgi:hypothetical protein